MSKFSTIKGIFKFLAMRKKYWLMPLILIIVLLGVLIVFTESSVLAPFIYTLF